MPDAISQMTPLLPERADDLQDLALEVIQRSASLGTRQHPITLQTLRELPVRWGIGTNPPTRRRGPFSPASD